MTVTASTASYPFRTGLLETITLPTAANTAYNPGDIIWNNSGVAAIASSLAWSTNLAGTQAALRVEFLGVCMDKKLATDASTTRILIATRGKFSYPCVAVSGSALPIGTLVGNAKDTGNNLLDQVFVNVSGLTDAIGTLVEPAAVGATELQIYLQSFLIYTSLAVSA